MVSKPLQSLKLVSKPLAAMQTVPNLGGVAAFVKAVVKHTTPLRGFLRRGFLNPSMQVNSILMPKVSVASSSTLVLKEYEVAGVSIRKVLTIPSSSCVTPIADKGVGCRVNNLDPVSAMAGTF